MLKECKWTMDTSNVYTVSDYHVATWTVAFASSKRVKWDWYEPCIDKNTEKIFK